VCHPVQGLGGYRQVSYPFMDCDGLFGGQFKQEPPYSAAANNILRVETMPSFIMNIPHPMSGEGRHNAPVPLNPIDSPRVESPMYVRSQGSQDPLYFMGPKRNMNWCDLLKCQTNSGHMSPLGASGPEVSVLSGHSAMYPGYGYYNGPDMRSQMGVQPFQTEASPLTRSAFNNSPNDIFLQSLMIPGAANPQFTMPSSSNHQQS